MAMANQKFGHAKVRFERLGCVLLGLAATTLSCASSNGKPPKPARSQPSATLMVFVRDSDGKPVEGCDIAIQMLKIGAMSESDGHARITNVLPGSWMVSWKMVGAFGDSTTMRFFPGKEETLRAVLKLPEPETTPGLKVHD